jgi:hypothetical protein
MADRKRDHRVMGAHMTLFDYDLNVRPHLTYIGAGAEMAARHARLLPFKPGFETLAQGELAEARRVLESALASIIAAEAIYEDKELENSSAD